MKIFQAKNKNQFKLITTNFTMLFLSFVLPVIIVCVIVTYFSFTQTQKEIDNRLNQSVTVASDTLFRMLNNAKSISRFSDNNLVVINRVLSTTHLDYSDSQLFKTLYSFLSSSINYDAGIDSIYIYIENNDKKAITSSNGLVSIASLLDKEWLKYLSSEYEDQSLFVRTKKDYTFEAPRKIITYVHKFTGYNGILVINFTLNDMVNILDSIKFFDSQTIFIKDRKDCYIFGSSNSEDMNYQAFLCSADSNKLSEKIIYKESAIPVFGLSSITTIPFTMRFSLALSQNSVMIVILCLLIILCMILSYLLYRKNIRQLKEVNELFKYSDSNIPFSKINKDEHDPFSILLQNILQIFIEKKQLQLQLSERKLKLQVAQLQALQYQMNPHFLYNALQAVSYEILQLSKGIRTDANLMIENLSDIIRYSLGKTGSLVTLREEILNCNKYIEIQKIRYQNWFKVNWLVPEDLLDYPVLRLMLQPIIENSIIHGLRNKKNNGILNITIKKRNQRVYFYIYDNGVGMDCQTLNTLKSNLAKKIDEINYSSPKIGLENTNFRLILEYSPNSLIQIFSSTKKGTLVFFSIPI